MSLSRVLALVALIILLAGFAFAQLSTSRLEGTVQDQSGAMIPGAKIEVVNVKTGIKSDTEANAQGAYIFPSLAPGTYSMTVESQGFRKASIANLELNVAATLTQVVKLEVGSVTESVVVEANAVRVQTADAQIARAITLRDIEMLPQLGRGPILLAIFNPGVQIDPSDNTYSRVNGTRQGSSNATLDGIEINDPVAPRLGLAMTPNTTDTVEEFRVVTNGGKAEYGRNAGGQVQMITRSGTNSFHGGAWDYLRNTKLNANNFFNNSSGQARPMYIRNIFGGKFEGPIKKDRTFFFGSYEGTRTHQQVVRNRTVLMPEIKQGIFRWAAPGGGVQSYDIGRNDPRGKGIDPSMKKIIALLPDPNNTDVGDKYNTAGFRFNAPANSFNDMYTIKVDHNVWDGHRAFFRWSWMRTYSIDTTNSAEARFPGNENGRQGGHRRGWSAGSDWTLTNTMVNEFRLGGQKTNSDFLRPRLHEMMINPVTFTSPIADPTDYAQGRAVPYTEITDSLSKIQGRHTLKMGLNIRYTTQFGWRDDYTYPIVYLSRTYGNAVPATVGPASGSAISANDRTRFENHYNELLGRIDSVLLRYYSDLQKYLPAGSQRQRTHKYREYGFFLQDDWKLRRNFTLNAGVRWEFFGVPFEVNGLQGTIDKASQMNLVNRITDLTVVKGGPYYNNDWNNFAPRIGFAWDVFGDGKTAVRGNWGVFYDRLINATLTPADSNTPGFYSDVRVLGNQNAGSDVRVSDGLPALPQPAAVVLQVPANRMNAGGAMNPAMRTGYVLHTSFSVQREIFRNTVVEAGYVGTRGIKLFMHSNLNQPRIYDDFLGAFQQLQAYRKSKTPVPAGNSLVKMFGSADAAVSAVSATNLDTGAVGAAANTVDLSQYAKYTAAGLPQTYLRNYPQFSTMYLGTNDGRSYYNSFQLSFRRQAGAWKFNANYTFSKSMDNWPSEGNGTSVGSVMDWYNTRLNRGVSDFNRPHSFNSSLIYTLPVGRGRKFLGAAPRWIDSLLGGWDLGFLNIWQSGNAFTVFSGRQTGPNQTNTWATVSGSRGFGSLQRRGDGVYLFSEADKANLGFPEAGFVGTAGRNTFRGPRYFNMDATLSKRFRITESCSILFRTEAYNLFNTANFGSPGNSMATMASLGKFSGTIGNPRIVQMAARFEF